MFNKLLCNLSVVTFIGIYSSSFPLEGQITEINEIESVRNYIKEDSLILLNVGDTLFSPSSMLSDYQWRQYFVERVNQLVSDPVIAQSIIDEVKGVIVEKIPKVCPEDVTPSFIEQLQNEKIPVLGYTTRFISTTYAENNGQITSNHLLAMGIDLSKTLSYYSTEEYHSKDDAFQYGMIFTNKNPIGPAISAFLLKRDSLPIQAILVDDSVETLTEAENALTPLGIQFQGLRYNRVDERKKAFDHSVANLQFLAYFEMDRLITDEQALQLIAEKPEIDWDAFLNEWILIQASMHG